MHTFPWIPLVQGHVICTVLAYYELPQYDSVPLTTILATLFLRERRFRESYVGTCSESADLSLRRKPDPAEKLLDRDEESLLGLF